MTDRVIESRRTILGQLCSRFPDGIQTKESFMWHITAFGYIRRYDLSQGEISSLWYSYKALGNARGIEVRPDPYISNLIHEGPQESFILGSDKEES